MAEYKKWRENGDYLFSRMMQGIQKQKQILHLLEVQVKQNSKSVTFTQGRASTKKTFIEGTCP